MNRRAFLRSAAGLPALASFPSAAQEPTFRVDVRLVRILATVKNSAGQPVGSLEKGDFQIFENGVAQDVALFERHTEQPLSVAVLMDTSASTAIELRYEFESVSRFLKALFREGNPLDSAAIYTFNYEVTLLSGFSRNLERLERSMKGVKPVGGTSLYDAIFLASEYFEDREGRRVVILVTDGGDTTSSKTYHQALEAVHQADAVLYPILVVPIANDPGRNVGGENALTTLAASTGGKMFAPSLGASLDSAFADILRDLRTQYLLGYYPKNVPPSDDRFHRIAIKVSGTDLRVSARSGYYGDSDRSTGWKSVR